MIDLLPPGFFLLLGAVSALLLRGRAATIAVLSAPLVSLFHLRTLPLGFELLLPFQNTALILSHVDKLSLLFGTIFHIVVFLGMIFLSHESGIRQRASGLFYGAAAIGVVFAKDLFSLFIWWECLTLGAVPLILAGGGDSSSKAAFRYLIFHIIGGLLLLSGIVLRGMDGIVISGALGLEDLSSVLIFIGVGVNAAWPFLHSWVIDAYPKSSPGGAVLLSALTTKTAVYVLARMFLGVDYLILIGGLMLVFPIFYAVIENDLRKVLSYSLINQVGFMMVGIGLGTELSVNGAVAHAFTHILYKSLLFMSIGAVLYRVGTAKATKLGGLARSMPWTCCFCIIGAASISGVPFFSGFISKSMIISGAAEGHFFFLWLVLLFASAGVLEHAGIKVPYFAFFGHSEDKEVKEAPFHMLFAMGIAAFLCILLGLFPDLLYSQLPYNVTYKPYTAGHIVAQLELLAFAGLAFILLVKFKLYPEEEEAENLDLDWLYRKGVAPLVRLGGKGVDLLLHTPQLPSLYSFPKFESVTPVGELLIRVVALLAVALLLAG